MVCPLKNRTKQIDGSSATEPVTAHKRISFETQRSKIYISFFFTFCNSVSGFDIHLLHLVILLQDWRIW